VPATPSVHRFTLAATLLLSLAVAAQGTSVLTGTVVDGATGKPVPDVLVTVTSPALQGEETAVTDAEGVYRIGQLPPGSFTLKLDREAYRPYLRQDVNLRVDRTVRVNVQLQPESLKAEEVLVVGRAPTVDVGSTTTGLNVGKEFVAAVPFVQPSAAGVRSFEALTQVAPQVVADQYGFGINGTTSPENLTLVDGLSVTDPSVGITGAALPVDFVEEANVITGGYQAEYGRATGGVLNVVTKSGSNEFHGSVFGNFTPGLLSGSRPEIRNDATIFRTNERLWNSGDFGVELGGPIMKDKLWFYAGFSPSFSRVQQERRLYRYLVDDMGNQLYDELGARRQAELPNTRQSHFADSRALSYIAKLTYLINADHNVAVSVSGSPTTSDTGAPFTAGLAGTTTTANNVDVAVRYAGGLLDKHLLIDATAGWHRQIASTLPSDGSRIGSTFGGAAQPQVIFRRTAPHSINDLEELNPEAAGLCDPKGTANATLCPATSAGREYTMGGIGFMQEAAIDRVQVKGAATYLFTALGHHTAKAGIDFERLQYETTKAYSGGAVLRESTSGDAFRDYDRYGYLTGPDTFTQQDSLHAVSSSNGIAAFVQDSWSVKDLVTVNLGLRYETQQLFAGDGTLGLTLNNMLSPRVGLIYDFTQQGRSKLFASYARYYEAIPLDIADRALTAENEGGFYNSRTGTPPCEPAADLRKIGGSCQASGNDVALGRPSDPSQKALSIGQGKTPVDPAIQPQSTDEIVVGGEYEVFADARAGVSYTRRYINTVIEDMSRDEGNTYFLGNPGYGLAKDFPLAKRDYDAVTVYFTKVFAEQWLAQVSYTWSYLRGNYAGLFRPETGQLDPNINSDFDLISLLANREGPLDGDRTHAIKAYGAKEFVLSGALSLVVGLSYEGRSGRPINYLASHPIYGENEAFVLPRGAGGRLPWTHTVNGKLALNWKATRENTVTLTADVFNMFNFAAVTAVDETLSSADLLPVVGAGNPQQQLCLAGANPSCKPGLKKFDEDASAIVDASVKDYNPNYKNVTAYQPPLTVRFGVKVSF